MRIIAGRFKSRQLKTAPLAGTRPTSDRLRETLFNVIASRVPQSRFLDAYSGMGAVGIEAISRGAASVVFVDQSRKACRIIRENLRQLDIDSGFTVLERDVRKALAVCAAEGLQFDVAFFDPPYDRTEYYLSDLEGLATKGLVAEDGVVVMEHSRRTDLPQAAAGFSRFRVLGQGDSALSFYRSEGA